MLSAKFPTEVIDPHHHFLDTGNTDFQTFLQSAAGCEIQSLPESYTKDVIQPLTKLGIKFLASVHVEAMPDDGGKEVEWVEAMSKKGRCSFVEGYVASCDLSREDADDELRRLVLQTPKVKGIRWILDYVGKFDGDSATHLATTRFDADYLKEPKFISGLGLLEKHNLSFDLQCAPIQLVDSAAAVFGQYPNLKVCIDHLGKPRKVLGDDKLPDGSINPNLIPNEEELRVWRKGMKDMAALPNVYVKISMLGYSLPGWIRTSERKEMMRSLVRETVELFGPNRCMTAFNWHVNGAVSDADNMSDIGPDAVELMKLFTWFFEGYSQEDTDRLFSGTAKEFYRLG